MSVSYAVEFEDLKAKAALDELGITTDIRYLDVGVNQPIVENNTYLFYTMGFNGVLVEPLEMWHELLADERPRDTLLKGAVGYTGETRGVIKQRGSHGGGSYITGLEWKDYPYHFEIDLFDLNNVIAEHFSDVKFPTYMSIDTEGHDLFILQTLDFDKYPIPVICAEFRSRNRAATIEFMESKGYSLFYFNDYNLLFKRVKLIGE